MEVLEMNRIFWKNRRVFLTGHTGFKGSWLALWLQDMGAEVIGYALEPPTEPNLFTVARVEEGMTSSIIADIRDSETFTAAMKAARPEIIIHMAAQPLVRHSYDQPVETYAVNVMGTINLLEAVRITPEVRAVLNITTDKCYENREWVWGYRENEPLGGHDPYSSSKACAEIVTAAWRRSYLKDAGVALASVRAGNVIGGGDWANDRLIPDILRALDAEQTLTIRSPHAIRPWQHVFGPLAGYLTLAERLCHDGDNYSEAWNFGPEETDSRSVQWIVKNLYSLVSGTSWQCDTTLQPHETHYLKLDSSKAKARLGWKPKWDLKTALDKTLQWHNAWKQSADMRTISLEQIHTYETTARPE